jgi:uncharacterized protein YceK
MRKLALILAVMVLAGCSTLEAFDNRVSCSMDGWQAYVNSMYGPVGVSSKIAAADAKAICAKGQ